MQAVEPSKLAETKTMSPFASVTSAAAVRYAAPLSLQLNQSRFSSNPSSENRLPLAKAAAQVLRDPILQQRLIDRVCNLLMEDVRMQRERNCFKPEGNAQTLEVA